MIIRLISIILLISLPSLAYANINSSGLMANFMYKCETFGLSSGEQVLDLCATGTKLIQSLCDTTIYDACSDPVYNKMSTAYDNTKVKSIQSPSNYQDHGVNDDNSTGNQILDALKKLFGGM